MGFGQLSLIVLSNIYLLKQRFILRRTREELVHEIMYSRAVEKLTLTDPLTGMNLVLYQCMASRRRHLSRNQ